MPACGSEGCTSGARLRSSSPPNSRSNSASPPLAWPISGPSASIAGSPGQISPIGRSFERSTSNLSNSSLPHSHFPVPERSAGTSAPVAHGHDATVAFPERRTSRCRHTWDREHDEIDDGSIKRNATISTTTKRIFRKRNERSSRGNANGNDVVSAKPETRTGKIGGLVDLSIPVRLIAWYVDLVLTTIRRGHETLSYVIWAPVIWISAWICVFWVIVQLPLNAVKWIILAMYTPAAERARSKRCVLINGGSTLQGLHLARNFYKAGARVVVCEIDGCFGLARFSTACARFYTVPRPGPGTAAEYVNALKNIVRRENAAYYVPVSCTVDAYYDALAKPHLEIQGCECFVPGTAEVTALEDPVRLMERCAAVGLSTPPYCVVNSADDLRRLYENGRFAGNDRHVMMSAGPSGMRERSKLVVPSSTGDGTPRNLSHKLEGHEISERRPWIVVREPKPTVGHQLITCTTIKNSRVVANVTCRLDEIRGLVPEDRGDVDHWLETFFSKPFPTVVNGHLSFKLAHYGDDEIGLVSMGCRVGVPLPYLCLTSVHPRLVWRPCRHFSRQNSASLIVNDRYKQKPGNCGSAGNFKGSSTRIRGTVGSSTVSGPETNGLVVSRTTALDNRDALFVYWDPLPYCAYYHLQLPFRRLTGAIRQRSNQHKPPFAVVR